MTTNSRYNSFSAYLFGRFKAKVLRVQINGGFTCPVRDGTKGRGGCIYCEPSAIMQEDFKEGLSVAEQIERGIEKIKRKRKAGKFIAYFQINTNTYGETDYLESLYREAISHPQVVGLAISTRPDCIPDRVLDLLAGLKKQKHLWIELGLQSAKDSTLEFVKRGHTAEDFRDAVERAAKKGIDVCAHVIFGLPGETKNDMLDTIRFISGLPVWGIKFHQLEVIKGTELEMLYQRGDVALLSLEEYAQIVVESLEILRPEVVIHRLSAVSPRRELLVAPLWGLNRFAAKERIEESLKQRGTRQGVRWKQK